MITIINIGVFFYPLTSWKSPNEFRDWSSSSNVRISITNHSPALPCRGGWGNLQDMACGSNWISTISIMSSRLQPGTSHPLVPFLCTSNQQKKTVPLVFRLKYPNPWFPLSDDRATAPTSLDSPSAVPMLWQLQTQLSVCEIVHADVKWCQYIFSRYIKR